MKRVLFLSNGHGEDLSASLIARKLVDIGYEVDGLPIVGEGKNYAIENIRIIGKTRNFKTGGLGYNSLKGRINDLINGQIAYFIKKLFLVLRHSKNYEYFVVVGDIVPIFFAWLTRKSCFIYLVAYSSHYEGKLNLPWPCKYFLNSNKVKKIFSRDLYTAQDLSSQLNKRVAFYGNSFMDKLHKSNSGENFTFNIALFPGSRMPELLNNLSVMLDVLEAISNYQYFRNVQFDFGLIKDCTAENLVKIFKLRNWVLPNQNAINVKTFQFGFISVKFKWDSFVEILNQSNLVISMAGTAAEQAIGCSKPVIQIEGDGPQFTKNFADAQRRLLGRFVFCVTRYKNKKDKINKTVDLIIKIIYLIKLDSKFLIDCQENSLKRIGPDGACTKLVEEINQYITNENAKI